MTEAKEAMVAPNKIRGVDVPTTGRPPELLQDCDRKLSIALSNTPGARLHAREAAAAIVSKRDDSMLARAARIVDATWGFLSGGRW